MTRSRQLAAAALARLDGGLALAALTARDPMARAMAASALGAHHYFIDPTNGDNTNAGTDPTHALADFSTLNALGTLTAGTRIFLKRGTVFTQGLTVNGDNLVVSAYGSGARPEIHCDVHIAAGGWTYSGANDIWTTTVTLPNDAKASGNVGYGSAMMNQVTSDAALATAGANTAYMVTWGGATSTLKVRVSSGDNPNTNGVDYWYSGVLCGVNIQTGDNVRVAGILVRRAAHQDGNIRLAGTGHLVTDCRLEDGSRHAMLLGANSRVTNCYFYRVKDTQEGTAGNFVVWNQADMTTASYWSSGCTFDAGDGDAAVALAAHDSVNGRLALFSQHDNHTFIGCSPGQADSATYILNNPLLQNAPGLLALPKAGATATINNVQTGSTVALTASAHAIDMTAASCTLTLTNPQLTVGPVNTGSFINSSDATTAASITITGGKIILSGAGSSGFTPINITRGTLTTTGVTFGPTLGCPFNAGLFAKIGISQTGNWVSSNCTFPLGVCATINGVVYATLAALQTGGFDTGSTFGAFTASLSSSFTGPDENLEALAPWTETDGAAGVLGVRSNKLAVLAATRAGYKLGALSGADQYGRCSVQATSFGTGFVAIRMADSNNFLGARASGGTSYQAYRCVAGTLAQVISSTAVTPAANDDLLIAVRSDEVYLYVNNQLLGINALGTTSLDANTGAGFMAFTSATNPIADNVEYGALPAAA